MLAGTGDRAILSGASPLYCHFWQCVVSKRRPTLLPDGPTTESGCDPLLVGAMDGRDGFLSDVLDWVERSGVRLRPTGVELDASLRDLLFGLREAMMRFASTVVGSRSGWPSA